LQLKALRIVMTHILSYNRFFILGLFAFFALTLTFSMPINAQEREKPKLVNIFFSEKTNNPEAVKVIRKLYDDWIEETNFDAQIGEIKAMFLPLDVEGGKRRFIIGQLYDEPLGGCFYLGCKTVIVYDNGDNKWIGLFNAFIHNAWYDANSNTNKPANLIFSSYADNRSPAVWMWDGMGYVVVNNK